MKNPNRVVWSKGMFLTPQHFQLQDHYLTDLVEFRFGASHFANWGVTELRFNHQGLAKGVFTLERARGLLKDGTPFDIPDNDAPPATREFAKHFTPGASNLDVYLALPEQREKETNITIPASAEEEQGPAYTRYKAEKRDIRDEIEGVEEKPVLVARRQYRLVFGSEPREGLSALRVAQLSQTPAGQCVANPRFVAPCLDIQSSESLMTSLRGYIDRMAAYRTSLTKERKSAGKTDALLLHTVNTFLPLLQHIHAVRRGHPEPLYATLLQLAGALAMLDDSVDLLTLPVYQHEDLGACFAELEAQVRAMLDVPMRVNCVQIPLLPREPYVWGGSIEDDSHLKNSQFVLAINAKMGVDDLIREVPRRVRIASPGDLPRLIRNALPGLALRHTPVPPSAIRVQFGNQYFSLNQSGPLWDAVRQSKSVSVHAPSEIADAQMELLVVLGDQPTS